MSRRTEDQTPEQPSPTRHRARTLIEEMAVQGKEVQATDGYQQAQAFLDSIWQGKAVARLPSQPRPESKKPDAPQTD